MNGMTNEISIAIPAYRNANRLRRCLKSIDKIDPNWLSLAVVTDDSGDGQVANELRNEFESVKWIVHETNQGFARAANDAVLSCQSKWVLLLNDDSEIVDDPRPALLPLLTLPNVFAVSLRSTDEQGNFREGAKKLVWRFGIAKILHNTKDQAPIIDGVSESSYAVGGHAVYNREMFMKLGGFDSTYHPFYWEDVDISVRASRLGSRTLFASDAAIVHRNDGAIKSHNDAAAIRYATWLNRLIFSQRHAQGLQRSLLKWGLKWNYLHSLMTNDEPRKRALAEFSRRLSDIQRELNG